MVAGRSLVQSLFRDAARDLNGQRDGAGVSAGVQNLGHQPRHLDVLRPEGLRHLGEEAGHEEVDGPRAGHESNSAEMRAVLVEHVAEAAEALRLAVEAPEGRLALHRNKGVRVVAPAAVVDRVDQHDDRLT